MVFQPTHKANPFDQPFALEQVGGGLLVYDTFTDTDGTLLTAHTPDVAPVSSAWADVCISGSLSAGSVKIAANKVRFDADAQGCVINCGQTDYSVSARWTPGVGGLNRNSIVFRFGSNTNLWLFNCREVNGDANIVEAVSGIGNTRATAAFAFTEGVEYLLEVRVSGTTCTGYINGVQVVTYASMGTHLSSTLVGICRNTSDNLARFDEFVVTRI